MMTHTLAAFAARTAPRYTSYPTLDHFSPLADPNRSRRWLGDLGTDATLSLYLHIPYCRDICWYCGCATYASRRAASLAAYVDILIREIDLVAAVTSAKRVSAVRWGGGTPNLLPTDMTARLWNHLDRRFDLGRLEEHAMELDPRHLTTEQVDAYAGIGLRSASLGVQDLSPHVQAAIGRIQSLDQVRRAVDLLRRAPIATVAMDLMYGLPFQTVDDVRASVESILTMSPDRVAIFGYDHTPWRHARQRRIDAATLPSPALRLAQASAARQMMLAAGFVAVGVDHFARSGDALATAARLGRLKRNFHGYVADRADAVLGFGASAVSTLPQGFIQNAAEVGAWRRAIAAGGFAGVRGHIDSEEDRRRREIIGRLLCGFAVDLADFGGWDAFAPEVTALERFARDGLVEIEGERLFLPLEARSLARVVAQLFDAYPGAAGAPPAI